MDLRIITFNASLNRETKGASAIAEISEHLSTSGHANQVMVNPDCII